MSEPEPPPQVRTRTGWVQGRQLGSVKAFLGVPYAAAPFGPLRMRPPRPHARWTGLRPAVAFGPTAPKGTKQPPWDRVFPEPVVPGDECLNLNVWTPELGAAALPVLVWIHGGAWHEGSSAVPQFDGSGFARDGVVLVSINYRLGAEGFLYTDDETANCALRDMIAALDWVRSEIAGFGGDPGQVTIGGESAGAMSVATLMAMPAATGLFRRAIAQSGAGHFAISPRVARHMTAILAREAGAEPTREALADVEPEQLVAANDALVEEVPQSVNVLRWGNVLRTQMIFQPVYRTASLPERPIDAVEGGAGRDVDLLIGTNRDEQRVFLVPDGSIDAMGEAKLAAAALAYGLSPRAFAQYRREARGATPGELAADISTDWFFRIPAVRLADAHAASGGTGSTHFYEFAWRPPTFEGRLGACHTLELGFTFDTLRSQDFDVLAGEHPPQALADTMHGAWVRFVRGEPPWPAYTTDSRPVMRFDLDSEVVDDPYAEVSRRWPHR